MEKKKNIFKKTFGVFSFRKHKMKVGLALGGGGTRGFAHIGVLKAFEESGITFHAVAGTSVGSLVGALYAAGKTADEMLQLTKTLKAKDIRPGIIPFVPSRTDGLERIVKQSIGESIEFKDLKVPFCAVATDVKTGKEVHIINGDIGKAVAGSCAFPMAFNPVPFDNYLLYDGCLLNNIPSNVLKKMGCDVIIAVDINPSRGQGTESTKLFDLLNAALGITMKGNSLKGYLDADIIIKADTKKFSATKQEGADEMISMGYEAAKKEIENVKRFIVLAEKGKKRAVNKLKLFMKNNEQISIK